jgi:AraC family transcriptional regulator of adaptative response/methylated-DNA-[protein]-cysteine methyltransferase
LANIIDNPKAFRAVANANGSNNIAIVIPCHRITGSNSYLGGYNGGVGRKKWLLQHELKTLCT